MGIRRYRILQLEPWQQEKYGRSGRLDHIFEVHQQALAEDINLEGLADMCARMSASLSDRDHLTIWALMSYFDTAANVSEQQTMQLFLRETPKIIYPPRVVRETAPIPPLRHFISPQPAGVDISELQTTELRHKDRS